MDSYASLPLRPGMGRHQWARDNQLEMRTLWMDATANLDRLNSREKVQAILDKTVAAGFNTVAVGVKSPCGFVLYNSRIAPKMKNFLNRTTYPEGYDLLQTVIEEGHKRGLEVHAFLMVFSDGRKLNRSGPAYGPHAAWQSVQYLRSGKLVKQADAPGGTFVFLNPAHPAAQDYQLSIIKEIVSRYDVDGVLLDRLRYAGIDSDFSPASRIGFEKYIGKKVARFPQDIFTWNKKGPVPGNYYKPWLEYRASVISGFVKRAAKVVKSTRPGTVIGCSVGSWYPTYVNEGVNWGSTRFNPGKEYFWATSTYRKTGYADYIDYLAPHCYSRDVEILDSREAGKPDWRSVQGAAQITRQAVANACWVYGGIYAHDYQGKPQEFLRAMLTVREETNGVMAFDLSQIDDYGWWELFPQVFRTATSPPHRKPGWLAVKESSTSPAKTARP
ncbi:MAG: family 10 glycosylhydrolase [Armatimonadetes bacterium]|nr:family 10 glycosylhydrolase [Armatimonadota bacterium]